MGLGLGLRSVYPFLFFFLYTLSFLRRQSFRQNTRSEQRGDASAGSKYHRVLRSASVLASGLHFSNQSIGHAFFILQERPVIGGNFETPGCGSIHDQIARVPQATGGTGGEFCFRQSRGNSQFEKPSPNCCGHAECGDFRVSEDTRDTNETKARSNDWSTILVARVGFCVENASAEDVLSPLKVGYKSSSSACYIACCAFLTEDVLKL